MSYTPARRALTAGWPYRLRELASGRVRPITLHPRESGARRNHRRGPTAAGQSCQAIRAARTITAPAGECRGSGGTTSGKVCYDTIWDEGLDRRVGDCTARHAALAHRRARPGLGRIGGDGAMRVLVVGGGPAGITAALQARELGADVTLLEAERSAAPA